MEKAGRSSSVPPVPVPSSVIVPTPVASVIVALVAPLRLTSKDSLPSKTVSWLMVTVMDFVVSPAAKVRVPAVAV